MAACSPLLQAARPGASKQLSAARKECLERCKGELAAHAAVQLPPGISTALSTAMQGLDAMGDAASRPPGAAPSLSELTAASPDDVAARTEAQFVALCNSLASPL